MWRVVSGIGPVAEIPAVELRRDRTLHREIERRQPVEDRCIISDAEERNWRLCRPGVDYWGLCCLWCHTSLSLLVILGDASAPGASRPVYAEIPRMTPG